MILLSGHSLTALKKIDLEKQSLTLRERDSTSMIQPVDMSDIGINSWFKDESNPGAGIVWRVKNIQQMYDQKANQVQLEHIINTLKDRVMFGEVTPATITGSDSATVCTARQAITYILNQQSDWVLYNFDASYESVSNNYKFNGDSLFDALDRVTKTLSDAWWSYDMSVYPFRLNITARPSGVACELRPGRNLKTVSRTIDRTNMYTRFYPIGHDDLHITGGYVSQNESTYGVVCKVEVDMSLTTEAELTAWANEKLSRHSEPLITIAADGLELASATGESLDALTLCRICRTYVDEFGTTIQERITELTYSDKVNQPENVRVTMSNKREDVLQYMADVVNEIKEGAGPSGSGRSGGGGRGGAAQQREDHAWFEDTDEHVAMVAEGIIGVDAQGNPNWTRLSSIIVDGTGIHANVHDLFGEITANQADIQVNETGITTLVTKTGINSLGQNDTLYSKITQNASEISTLVSKTGVNSLGQSETLYSKITQNATEISTKVSKNNVISEINQTAETITISASRIDLSGYVTASSLDTVEAKIDNLAAGNTTASKLSATILQANSTFNCFGHSLSLIQKTLDGTTYHFLGYYG